MTHSHNPNREPSSSDPHFDPWLSDIPLVNSPSDIIATIPGTLGFYPQESVVVIGLVPDEVQPGSLVLGPVLRADIPDAGEIAHTIATRLNGVCVTYFGLIITRTPQSDSAVAAIAALEQIQCGGGHPLIDVCWLVSEIAQGTPYEMVFGPDPDEMDCMGHPMVQPEWERGTIGSVIGSPTMRAMRDNGALPALSREDTFAFFDCIGECCISTEITTKTAEIAAAAQTKAGELRRKLDKGEPGAGELVRHAAKALREAPKLPIVSDDAHPDLGTVFPDEEGLEALAATLSRSMFRDCLIGQAIRHPETAATALITVARTFDGIIRANALSLWALVAISRGLSSWASTALSTAQDDMPRHSMSAICLQIMGAGKQHELVTTILEGCEIACASLLAKETGAADKGNESAA